MTDDIVVRVEDLIKSFGTPGDTVVHAVDHVSFTVGRGQSLGIVGESGSGKSTIARILVGLERPTAGAVDVGGVDLAGRADRGRRRALARAVQMVFQDPYGSLDRRLSVGACLAQALRVHTRMDSAEVRRRTAELLDHVRLPASVAEQFPRHLSGGQRQRVAIARALAPRPSCLVLDEAVSALDVSVQAQILQVLDDIRRDGSTTLIFVSHDLAVVQEVTSSVLVLHRGRAVEHGATVDVLGSPQHAYTRLLLASVPGPGWDPEEVLRQRAVFEAAQEVDPTHGVPTADVS